MLEKRFIILFLLLVLLGLMSYAQGLRADFVLDDLSVIVNNPVITGGASLKQLFQFDPTRFLTHFSFSLNYHLGGLKTFGYHLVNLLIHVINSLLFLRFLTLTLQLPFFQKDKINPFKFIPVLCALIFFLHPIQTQAVNYIVQRSVLLACLFYFSSMIVYLRLRLQFNALLYAGFIGTALLGAMTKPVFVTLPLSLLLYEMYFFKEEKKDLKKLAFLFLPAVLALFLVPLFLMSFQLHALGQAFSPDKLSYATQVTTEIPRFQYLLTQFPVLVKYVSLLFCPIDQNVDHDAVLAQGWSIQNFSALVLLLVILAAAYFLRRRKPVLSFSVFWFFILLIPESSIFPLPDVIFEHRLYIATAAFSMGVVCALAYFVPNPYRHASYGGLLAVAFLILTFSRDLVWSDPQLLLEDAALKSPNKARVHNHLGLVYQKRNWLPLAEAEFRKAARLDSNYSDAFNNLGILYAQDRKYQPAVEQFKEAISRNPSHFEANFNLGVMYLKLGDLQNANAQLRKTLDLRSDDARVYYYLAKIYFKLHDLAKAEEFYLEALRYSPYFVEALYELGNIYLEEGLNLKAIPYYNSAVQLDPKNSAAHNTLGIAYIRAGEMNMAGHHLLQAFYLNPNDRAVCLNLAEYFYRAGEKEKSKFYADKAESLR